MNIRLSIEDRIVAQCRKIARDQGTSLNELVREYLEGMAKPQGREEMIDEVQRLWESSPGDSGGRRFRRADAYEGRL